MLKRLEQGAIVPAWSTRLYYDDRKSCPGKGLTVRVRLPRVHRHNRSRESYNEYLPSGNSRMDELGTGLDERGTLPSTARGGFALRRQAVQGSVRRSRGCILLARLFRPTPDAAAAADAAGQVTIAGRTGERRQVNPYRFFPCIIIIQRAARKICSGCGNGRAALGFIGRASVSWDTLKPTR